MTLSDIRRGLQNALAYGGDTHTVDDVLAQIEIGEARAWLEEDALIITEIQQYPRSKVIHFWLATGERDAVIVLSRTVLEWARKQGCDRATLAGRKGWLRVLADEGWEPQPLTFMQKDLRNG
jgi:hypothetical protein